MSAFSSIDQHRVRATDANSVVAGSVVYSPLKSLWLLGMTSAALIGGIATFTPAALALFLVSTAIVLLFGHSLGSHRKLIHNSFQCPKWLEYVLVYLGVQVGLAGPLGLLRQHELRDYAQRLPDCHVICAMAAQPGWTHGGSCTATWFWPIRHTCILSRVSQKISSTVFWSGRGCCNNCRSPCCCFAGAAGRLFSSARVRVLRPVSLAIGSSATSLTIMATCIMKCAARRSRDATSG